MLITQFRRTATCQLVAEVYLTGVTPLGAVSHRFNNFNLKLLLINVGDITCTFEENCEEGKMWNQFHVDSDNEAVCSITQVSHGMDNRRYVSRETALLPLNGSPNFVS